MRAAWAVALGAWLVGSGVARAELPDRSPRSWDVGTGQVKRLAASADAHLVAGVSGDGKVFAVDTETWEMHTRAPCDVRSVAVEHLASEDQRFVYAGCEDGFVYAFLWKGGELTPFRGSGTISSVQMAKNPLVGLWMGGDGLIYGLAEADGEVLRLHELDPRTGALDTFPEFLELNSRDYVDGVLRRDLYGTGEMLYVAHGERRFSYVNLTTRVAPTTFGANQAVDPDDITLVPQSVAQAGALAVYFADADRGLVSWNGAITGGIRGDPFQYIGSGLTGARAVGTSSASNGAAEGLLIFRRGNLEVYDLVNSVPNGSNAVATLPMDDTVVDVLEGEPGYVFAGDDAGRVHLLTAYPFLDRLTVAPDIGETGTEVEVAFTLRSAGSWRLQLGGTRTGGGTELASGDGEAGQRVTTRVTVGDGFAEGRNDLWVVLQEGGLAGGTRGGFTLDNAPPMVDFGEASVTFGDGALELAFFGADATDVAFYDIYLSTEPFSRRDWPAGGPTSQATDPVVGDTDGGTTINTGVDSPVRIEAPEDGGLIRHRISGLGNYVTYYLAVRAVDADGTEGPMSRVVSEMPRPTFNAGDLLGEEGGSACSAGGSATFGWLGAAGAVAALRRRRRAARLAVVVGATLLGVDARAQEGEQRGLARFDRDISPAWASFEFRHDFQQLQGEVLQESFAPWMSTFRFEAGPQLFRVAEIDFGLGLSTKKGFQLDPTTLERSGEEQRIQTLPLSIGLTARAHIIDEQPIVPYVGAGIDWVFYRIDEIETGDTGVTVDKAARVAGSKQGWHWQVGGNILLDALAPGRAAQLEATTGINDTWLTVEYRSQQVGKGTPLDLSGWALGVGLKLDY